MKKLSTKKVISIILAIIMVASVLVPVFACEPYNALVNKFPVYRASNTMKYAAYEPELTENTKYPLVVYVHGLGHAWNDNSFRESGLTYWADDEIQAKFKEGGAYLLMPKIPEVVVTATQHERVFKVIKEYVEAHKDTIDTDQIYIMGGSAGGALTWRVICAHPDYFKKAVVLCGCKILTGLDAKAIKDMPVWMISAKTDPLVWYFLFSGPNWARLSRNSNVSDQCRHTVFSRRVQLPDGSKAAISHLLAKTIGWNLCRLADEQPLDGMGTINGNNEYVDVSFDNAIIEWLQSDVSAPMPE